MIEIIENLGTKAWRLVAEEFVSRTEVYRSTKQCRDRWYNTLCIKSTNKGLNDSEISEILSIYDKHPGKWVKISKAIKLLTENQVKNFFYSTIRRNIRKFNKGKIGDEKICDKSLRLLGNAELKQILLAPKHIKKFYFSNKFLSREAIDFMKDTKEGISIDNEITLDLNVYTRENNEKFLAMKEIDDINEEDRYLILPEYEFKNCFEFYSDNFIEETNLE